ncbi:hypothetical protein C2S52_013258 [Perilla frutescens var. hirtella]|nr:hypothetical protein C2S52_013258 [Perilla frutescens var. hirtella]
MDSPATEIGAEEGELEIGDELLEIGSEVVKSDKNPFFGKLGLTAIINQGYPDSRVAERVKSNGADTGFGLDVNIGSKELGYSFNWTVKSG